MLVIFIFACLRVLAVDSSGLCGIAQYNFPMDSTGIDFNRPTILGGELKNVQRAIEGGFTSGNGPLGREAEKSLSQLHGGSEVLLTPSCSSALELAARLVGFSPGDEIIVPSYTFVTTVSSFVANGAKPVFCDIDPVTLGLDLEQTERLITERTKAICIVHYAGVPADPEGFARLAQKHRLILIEDNAHGLGGNYQGQTLGTFGAMSTLSFHETKNITCGEGGALVLNDLSLVARAKILQEKGTNRSQFLNGQVDKYTWVDVGSSWVLSDILAAILVGQLDRFNEIQRRRMDIWSYYATRLEDWASCRGVVLAPKELTHTAHMFYLIFSGEKIRTEFTRHMAKAGISSVFHYQPLHRSLVGAKFHENSRPLPITDWASGGLVRLPLHLGLGATDLKRIVGVCTSF